MAINSHLKVVLSLLLVPISKLSTTDRESMVFRNLTTLKFCILWSKSVEDSGASQALDFHLLKAGGMVTLPCKYDPEYPYIHFISSCQDVPIEKEEALRGKIVNFFHPPKSSKELQLE
jgi:hypothetical protein